MHTSNIFLVPWNRNLLLRPTCYSRVDQGAKPQDYRKYFEVWQHRATREEPSRLITNFGSRALGQRNRIFRWNIDNKSTVTIGLFLLSVLFIICLSGCSGNDNTQNNYGELPEVAVYWDEAIDTGIVVDENNNRLVVQGNRITWTPAEGATIVMLTDEQGRLSEILGEDYTILFDNYVENKVDMMAILPGDQTIITRDVDLSQFAESSSNSNAEENSKADVAAIRLALFEKQFAKILKDASFSLKVGTCVASTVFTVGTAGTGVPSMAATCGSLALDLIIEKLDNPEARLGKNIHDLMTGCGGAVVGFDPVQRLGSAIGCFEVVMEQAAEASARYLNRFVDDDGDVSSDYVGYSEELHTGSTPVPPRPRQHQAVACFSHNPQEGVAPQEVYFDASCSNTTDPNDIHDYHWEMVQETDSIKTPVTIGSGRYARASMRSKGHYTIILKVRSGSGAEASTLKIIEVAEPVSPAEGSIPCFKEYREGSILARVERICVATKEECAQAGGMAFESLGSEEACKDLCSSYKGIELSSMNNDGSDRQCHEKVCVDTFTGGSYSTIKGSACGEAPVETGGTGGEGSAGESGGEDCESRLTKTIWGWTDGGEIFRDYSFSPDGTLKFFSRMYDPAYNNGYNGVYNDTITSGTWTIDGCSGEAIKSNGQATAFTLNGEQLTMGADVYKPFKKPQTPLGYSKGFP